jgi:hypothetical protein
MARWQRAHERYEHQTRAWRLGREAREREATRLRAAAARVELFDVLVADGWRPDEMVREQIAQDREAVLEAELLRTATPPDEPDDLTDRALPA